MAAPRAAKRQRIIYAETYRVPGLPIKRLYLPSLPSATGFAVTAAYVLKAGRIELEGQTFEFQDVRICLKEKQPTPVTVIAEED